MCSAWANSKITAIGTKISRKYRAEDLDNFMFAMSKYQFFMNSWLISILFIISRVDYFGV